MLREANFQKIKKEHLDKEDCISVVRKELWWVRNSCGKHCLELAPSEPLLNDFKKLSIERGNTAQSHNSVFKEIDYEQRFRREISDNPGALKILEQISNDSKGKDIYLVCYEGAAKACHRRILLRICEEKFGAKVQVEGVEP